MHILRRATKLGKRLMWPIRWWTFNITWFRALGRRGRHQVSSHTVSKLLWLQISYEEQCNSSSTSPPRLQMISAPRGQLKATLRIVLQSLSRESFDPILPRNFSMLRKVRSLFRGISTISHHVGIIVMTSSRFEDVGTEGKLVSIYSARPTESSPAMR